METIEGQKIPLERTPESFHTFFEGEGDKKAFFATEALRKEVESLHGWNQTKEKAKLEIGELSSDIIPRLFEQLDPYVELIPAGHSKGHVYRDFIISMINLRDPSLENIDEVEKLIGVLGGTFHDIGNSVVERYDEPKRFSGHAEVGAYLFGELAKDILPPNLLKLTQYAIAARTHYTKDIAITKEIDGKKETLVKRVYEDKIVDGSRTGILLTRMADRVDAQGIQMVLRQSLVKVEPTADYDHSTGFHQTKEDQSEDFKHQFSPVVRTEQYRDSLSLQDRTKNVLEHAKMFRDSQLEESVYSQNDTPYYKSVFIIPSAEEQLQFEEAVLAQTGIVGKDQIDSAFDVFYSLCRIVEPGPDINNIIELFKQKFSLLTEEERSHWANGYNLLPALYDRWYQRIDVALSGDFSDGFSGKTKAILEHGNNLAKQKLKDFKLQI